MVWCIIVLSYKFQGSRVYPEYKDNRVHFHFFQNMFSLGFCFLQKRKTYKKKKSVYKRKKQGNTLALFTAASPFSVAASLSF